MADVPTAGALDTIKNTFRDNAGAWVSILQSYATRVFWILAAIDITWMAILLILSRGDITDFAAQTVRKR